MMLGGGEARKKKVTGSGVGDPGYLNQESLSGLQREIGAVERTFNALIKSLENKPLNPGPLESSTPFSQIIVIFKTQTVLRVYD